MRQLSAALQAALRSPSLIFALLVEVDHPAGTAWLWTGTGPLVWDGKTWKGVGNIGGVTGIESNAQIAIQSVELTLGCASSAELDTFLSGEIKGRLAKVWWVAISEQCTVIPDPILLTVVDIDTRDFNTGEDGSITLKITGQPGFWQLEKPLSIAWSSEEQKKRYPDDTGFDLIPGLVGQKLSWTLT